MISVNQDATDRSRVNAQLLARMGAAAVPDALMPHGDHELRQGVRVVGGGGLYCGGWHYSTCSRASSYLWHL